MPADDAVTGHLNLNDRVDAYQKYRRYLTGRHPLMFATAAFERFFHNVIGDYQLNLTPAVVSAPAERLDLNGWEGSTDRAQTVWDEMGGPLLANKVHRESLSKGDAYTLTWPAGGQMSGPDTVWALRADEATVIYDDETPGAVRFAIKQWREGDRLRINVYYPDRVERWQTEEKAKGKLDAGKPLEADDLEPVDDDAGDTISHSYGRVPIVHFPNGAGMDLYGRSELVDVLPLQDALNKHAVDILVGSESVGFPLRALLGFAVEEEPVLDADGQPQLDEHGRIKMAPSNLPDYDPRIDRFLTFGGENTRLIQLDPANMEQLTTIKENAANDIAQVSGIPPHYLKPFTGNIPSGESLRVVEMRLTAKVEDRQQTFTPRWGDQMAILGVDARPRWADPTRMDVTEMWDLVQTKLDVGMPFKQALVETGHYTADEVDDILREAQDGAASIGGQMVAEFNAGRDPAELLRS